MKAGFSLFLVLYAAFLTGCSPGFMGADTDIFDAAPDPDAFAQSDVLDVADPGSGDIDIFVDIPGFELPDVRPDEGCCEDVRDSGIEVDMVTDRDGDGLTDFQEAAIGTDPDMADTDRDGILDGAEVEDGTDPGDPSSAAAWHPELEHHPRLFFDAADLPALAAKMSSTATPVSTVAARIRSAAAVPLAHHPEGGFDLTVDRARGQMAENASFIALVEGDAQMLEKAVAAIIDGYVDPSTANLASDSDYDLYGAEALVGFCSAWDFIAGNPAVDNETLLAVRRALERRIDDFRYLIHEGPLFYMMIFARNNHVLKVLGAFGLCAMSLNDRETAASDLSEAMTGIDWLFNNFQATPDGGMAEGYHYLTYGSDSYLPLFVAWHRFSGGASFPFKAVPAIQGENPLVGQVVPVTDFVANPVTRNTYRLALESVTPDGLCPDVDDSNGAAQHGAILNRLFGDPDFLWQWFMPAAGFDSAPLHVLSLASYDGETPPAQPSAPLDFMKYDAGMAVFRSSWESGALYAHLSGEHGAIRVNGLGHEHPDELSFFVQAFGRPLIIDPGYINFEQHALVFRPKDHNTILVDGVGSPFDSMSEVGIGVGTDAWLSCMGTQGDFTWSAVTTAYQGVQFQRRIVRVGQDYFLIDDMIDADDPHQYTWLLNGMGGGTTPDSSFAADAHGATWTNGDASVRAFVVPASGTPVVSSALEEHHATAWGQWNTHERMAVDVVMEPGSAGFLSVIMPSATFADPQPEIMSVPDAGVAMVAVSIPGADPLYVCSARASVSVFPEVGSPITLDRGLNVFRYDGTGNFERVFYLPYLPTAAADPSCGLTGD